MTLSDIKVRRFPMIDRASFEKRLEIMAQEDQNLFDVLDAFAQYPISVVKKGSVTYKRHHNLIKIILNNIINIRRQELLKTQRFYQEIVEENT